MRNRKSMIKIISFIVVILVILICNHRFGWSEYLGNKENLLHIKEVMGSHMIAVFFLYVIITIIGCAMLALPGMTFALAAGILFGPFLGIFASLIATTLGAMVAFLVGRFFLKDAVKPMLEKNKTLKRLLFSGNEKNYTILLLITRIVPLFPYNLQNFAYGITDVSFAKYSVLTFIFMLPGASFFVIGAAGLTAGDNRWMYFIIAGVIAVIVTLFGMWIRKKYLPETEETERKLETEDMERELETEETECEPETEDMEREPET